MAEQHPITPPPELVKQWLSTYFSTTITGEVSDVSLLLPPKPPAGALIRSWRRVASGFLSCRHGAQMTFVGIAAPSRRA
jgi:hypothetical protein